MTRRQLSFLSAVIVLVILGAAAYWLLSARSVAPTSAVAPPRPVPTPLREVVVAEAARTLLYLPLYVANDRGFFRSEGLDVKIITAGTATNAMAMLLSSKASFAQADPMYVPISRKQGAPTKVIGQVVGKIAIWAVTKDPGLQEITRESLTGRTVVTHPRPMTAFAYTETLMKQLGVSQKKLEIIQAKPGTELASLMNGTASIAITVEPAVSVAEANGGRVIYSFARQFGPRVLTGVMTTESTIRTDPKMVAGVSAAYEKALKLIASDPTATLSIAGRYFPDVPAPVLRRALERLVAEQVFPVTFAIDPKAWEASVEARLAIGDLTKPVPSFQECVFVPE